MWRLRSTLRSIATSIAAFGLFGACAPMMRSVETPIPMRIYGDIAQAKEVFILLPGLQDHVGSFEERGFLAVARELLTDRTDAAFVAVDAHFGYYRERSIERRLKDEVLGELNGKKVTLVGVSLGGFGALITARRHPGLVNRVVLIAPFLGWPENIQRLKAGAAATPRDKMEGEVFALWRWLEVGAEGIPIALLYGRDDKFRKAFDQLASSAPAVTLRAIEGAHDWRTWNTLWADWLTDHVAGTTAVAEVPARSGKSRAKGVR